MVKGEPLAFVLHDGAMVGDTRFRTGGLHVNAHVFPRPERMVADGIMHAVDVYKRQYHCNLDDFYLIPTAEVPVTNIYRDVILDEKDLPVKNCAYTQCFRREAGSYGKDVRGLNRLHEFSKVELVRIDKPEHSEQSHQEMLAHVEGLLQKLELPYRILRLCGGDMSFTSSICYDFEVYSEAQKRWLEVSSVSNFDTYQANRLKCR